MDDNLYVELRDRLLADPVVIAKLVKAVSEQVETARRPHAADIYFKFWGLSTQAGNSLTRGGIDPRDAFLMDKEQLMNVRNIGSTLADEIIAKRKPLPY